MNRIWSEAGLCAKTHLSFGFLEYCKCYLKMNQKKKKLAGPRFTWWRQNSCLINVSLFLSIPHPRASSSGATSIRTLGHK